MKTPPKQWEIPEGRRFVLKMAGFSLVAGLLSYMESRLQGLTRLSGQYQAERTRQYYSSPANYSKYHFSSPGGMILIGPVGQEPQETYANMVDGMALMLARNIPLTLAVSQKNGGLEFLPDGKTASRIETLADSYPGQLAYSLAGDEVDLQTLSRAQHELSKSLNKNGMQRLGYTHTYVYTPDREPSPSFLESLANAGMHELVLLGKKTQPVRSTYGRLLVFTASPDLEIGTVPDTDTALAASIPELLATDLHPIIRLDTGKFFSQDPARIIGGIDKLSADLAALSESGMKLSTASGYTRQAGGTQNLVVRCDDIQYPFLTRESIGLMDRFMHAGIPVNAAIIPSVDKGIGESDELMNYLIAKSSGGMLDLTLTASDQDLTRIRSDYGYLADYLLGSGPQSLLLKSSSLGDGLLSQISDMRSEGMPLALITSRFPNDSQLMGLDKYGTIHMSNIIDTGDWNNLDSSGIPRPVAVPDLLNQIGSHDAVLSVHTTMFNAKGGGEYIDSLISGLKACPYLRFVTFKDYICRMV